MNFFKSIDRLNPARIVKRIGPGVVTGAADDDPSGIVTYATAGATFGFAFLWTALLTYPLMCTVEYISAKIALVSGEGLSAVLKEHYPRPILYAAVALLVIANTMNAGTDIGAVAAAINLLVPQVSMSLLIVPVGMVLLTVQVFGSYKVLQRVLQWLTLSLLAYLGTVFFIHFDPAQVFLSTIIPSLRFDGAYLAMLVAILGTTITPYCLFWQADEEVEEERAMGRQERSQRLGATDSELRGAFADIDLGMAVCIAVMYSIMLTSAVSVHDGGVQIKTAADAAAALRPMAGKGAELLFALGIIGTGLLAVPVLTASAAYALAEAFDWDATLDSKLWQGRGFYCVIIASTLVGIAVVLSGVNPMLALVWAAILNGLLAPPILVLIMLVSNNKQVMGEHTNSFWTNVIGWSTAAVMSIAGIALILTALVK